MKKLKIEVLEIKRQRSRSSGLTPTVVKINGHVTKLSKLASWCPLFLYGGLVIKIDDYVKDDGYVGGIRKQVSDALKLWNTRICRSPDRIFFQEPVATGYTLPDNAGRCGGLRWMAQKFLRLRTKLSKTGALEIKRVVKKFGILDVITSSPSRNCATKPDGAPVIYDWGIIDDFLEIQ